MLTLVCDHLDEAQTALGRPLLLENPTAYLPLAGHDWDEVDFLTEISRRTGCGLLVDVNNVYLSARNMGLSAEDWLDRVPPDLIGEIHLAGHRPDPVWGEALLIDSHDAPVSEAVWSLYARLVYRTGPRPTLVERDAEVPPFAELLREQARASDILAKRVLAA
jgi:uncharacterized protein (UPF0276 family)